jgi:hypothetical protein
MGKKPKLPFFPSAAKWADDRLTGAAIFFILAYLSKSREKTAHMPGFDDSVRKR